MKLALASALVIAASGCASQIQSPPPSAPASVQVQPVGQSQLAPRAAADCIAQKWMAMSNQPVQMQYVFANETAFDVFAPGQPPLTGTSADSSLQAALVRPAPSGPGSMVSFRGTATPVSGAVGQCA